MRRLSGARKAGSMAAALCLFGAGPADGQALLDLDLGASYSLPPAGGAGIASTYVNGGLRLAGPFGSGGYLHASGFGGLALNEGGASWVSVLAGGGWSQPVSPVLSIGLAVAGEAFTVGDPVPYRAAFARAEPEIRFESARTMVRLAGYGGIGASEVTVIETFVRDTRFGRRVFEVGFPVATDLWAWGGTAEVEQGLGMLTPRLAGAVYDTPQGRYVVGRLGLEVRSPGGTFYAEGSVWDTPDGGEASVVAGVRVSTGARSSFYASGGKYGPDPLLDSPAAGGVGAGVSMGLAELGAVPELSWRVVDGAPQTLVLELKAEDAMLVECVGDFTGWSTVPMRRDGDVWVLELPVSPGVHHFGFKVDGAWYLPADAPGVAEDEWGEVQATIIVDDPDSTADVTPEADVSSRT